MIAPNHCPKFTKCAAAICPLDRDWNKRTHLKGERVCFYLRELTVRENLGGRYPAVFEKVIVREHPKILSLISDIKKQCERSLKASKKGIKEDAA
jgi:hypothetical protein